MLQKLIETTNNEEDIFRQYLLSTRKVGNLVQEKVDLQVPMAKWTMQELEIS